MQHKRLAGQQEMELEEGLLAPDSPVSCKEPVIKLSVANKSFKGEDCIFIKEKEKLADEALEWNVFMVCDGHCGPEAALYVQEHLWSMLKIRLPLGAPPTKNSYGSDAWTSAVSQAILDTFSQLNRDFCEDNGMAGTTVTLALVCGWTLTIANVGDSDAVLDTLNNHREVSVSHRLNNNEDEKARLRHAGVSLGKLSLCLSRSSGSEKEGLGPIRCWPGGLANSRSIGDFHAGGEINAVPNIKHFLLPRHGARLILASDGLWDIVKHSNAVNIVRRSPIHYAAERLISAALCQNGWAFHDDTSIIVVEVSPTHGEEFYALGKRLRKIAKPHKRLMKVLFCKGPGPVQPEEQTLGHLTVLGDADA